MSAMTVSEGREALRLCNSFNRLPTLISISFEMVQRDWLSLLGEEWSYCDNISENLVYLRNCPGFKLLTESPLLWRDAFMSDTEISVLNNMPDTVTVYRGCYANNKRGISWSLSAEVAMRFPHLHRYRQEGQPLLLKAEVQRDEIMGLKLDREEHEVIALRPKIRSIRNI